MPGGSVPVRIGRTHVDYASLFGLRNRQANQTAVLLTLIEPSLVLIELGKGRKAKPFGCFESRCFHDFLFG